MLHSATLVRTVVPNRHPQRNNFRLPIASRAELEQLLADDVPYGDLTTDALGIGAADGRMEFKARDKMVLALAEDAAAIIELAGGKVDLHASSGTALDQGLSLIHISEPTRRT